MAEIFRSTADLVDMLERPKFLVSPCLWTLPDQKHGQRHITLAASLSDGTATIQGISLRASCHPEGFDLPMHLTLVSEFNGKPRAFARIDINGSTHENRHQICAGMQFVNAGETHFHDTRLHSHIAIEQLFSGQFGDLPIATSISDMPEDFNNVMGKCGELLHIENMLEIEEPQWQPRPFI